MPDQLGEHWIAQVQTHRSAHLSAAFLPDVGGRVLCEQRRQLRAQQRDLGRREQVGQDQKSVAAESFELGFAQAHGGNRTRLRRLIGERHGLAIGQPCR